uniref:Uncharacterized protein n=1 Tax=Anguilla anguilla TaxID=7936 RepID=A0A0E9WID6_ANGAN
MTLSPDVQQCASFCVMFNVHTVDQIKRTNENDTSL